MRRKDREVRSFDEIIKIIDSCDRLHLAMIDNNEPYVVPMNFGYSVFEKSITFYMHSATNGRKIEILKKNPYVCIEMENCLRITDGDIPCKWSADFESVIAFGNIEFAKTKAEKTEALDAIMKHNGYLGDTSYSESMLEKTCILRMTTDRLTAKRKIDQKRRFKCG